MNNCTHATSFTKTVTNENFYTGETYTSTEYGVKTTFVDIDLHRMKCSRCGEIQHYSNAAKQHYEPEDGSSPEEFLYKDMS
jgi:hypothetical protein